MYFIHYLNLYLEDEIQVKSYCASKLDFRTWTKKLMINHAVTALYPGAYVLLKLMERDAFEMHKPYG